MTRAWALRLGAYLLVVGMFVYIVWSMDRDNTLDEAQRCVTSWETRADIRRAIAGAALVPVEALVAVVPDADPAQVEAYRAAANDGITEATAGIEDPECNLEEARDLVG